MVGTVALTATGAASKVLEEASNTVGFELGSELFSTTKDASINGIRNIWDNGDDDRSETLDNIENKVSSFDASTTGVGRRKLAQTARKAAQIAKENGDMEKYEYYMEKYNEYNE